MTEDRESGRDAYRRRAWADAYRLLSAADEAAPLDAEDLQRLATSAYLIGRDRDFQRCLERAHRAHHSAGDRARAARCAFWLGLTLSFLGEAAQATGWLSRARRLVQDRDCVEHGYLLLPVAEQQLHEDRSEEAHATAARAVALGERFADPDLIACALHLQGRSLIRQGRVEAGLALLDEAMLAVIGGELSPILTGLIYCSVIDACQRVFALGRAGEWTAALTRWCEQQPEMIAFTGTCLAHRAEILQFHGDWRDAIAEASRAGDSTPGEKEDGTPATAFYRQGEIHRLRGELEAAERAYRRASLGGRDPQPGLALLRMAQGRHDAARAAIRRALSGATDPLHRARLLPAGVEIMLAAGELEEARATCDELERIAGKFETDVLQGMASHACGSVALAAGHPRQALGPLRRAFEIWQRLDAPYEAARSRALIGQACHALGDADASDLEIEAATAVFERLGAAPQLTRLESLAAETTTPPGHPLTPRELQVLRLVATGKTNQAIADELFLSRRTIDRHLSNIFAKLDVSSRTAATAYAYTHQIL